MRCANCGEDLREGLRFCPTCGTPVPLSAPEASMSTPDQPAQTMQVRRPPPAGEPAAASAGPPPPQPPPAQQMPPPAPPQATYTPPPAEPFVTGRDPNANYSQPGPQPPPAGQRAPGGGIALGSAGTVPTPTGADFSRLWQWTLRLLKLDTSVFEEAYRTNSATIPVAVYVAVTLILSGLGAYLWIDDKIGFDFYETSAAGGHSATSFIFLSVILGTILSLVMLAAWSWITAFLLKQLGGVQADFLGIARVLGLAFLPMVLGLLMSIGQLWWVLFPVSFSAMGALAVVGVLESVDAKPGHAFAATLGGFAVFIIVMMILGGGTRDLAPGFFGMPINFGG